MGDFLTVLVATGLGAFVGGFALYLAERTGVRNAKELEAVRSMSLDASARAVDLVAELGHLHVPAGGYELRVYYRQMAFRLRYIASLLETVVAGLDSGWSSTADTHWRRSAMDERLRQLLAMLQADAAAYTNVQGYSGNLDEIAEQMISCDRDVRWYFAQPDLRVTYVTADANNEPGRARKLWWRFRYRPKGMLSAPKADGADAGC